LKSSNLFCLIIIIKLSFFKAIACCPSDSSSSRTARQHTQREAHGTGCGPAVQISSQRTKDQWPPNSPNINPMDYRVWGAMLEAYCKLKTKPKTSPELKESFQVIWGNLPQGPIDKAVKDFSNKTTRGWCCCLELAVNTSNIRSDNGILAFNHYLTALFQRCH